MSLFFSNHVEEFEIKKQLIKKSKQHTLAIKEDWNYILNSLFQNPVDTTACKLRYRKQYGLYV